MRGHLWLCRSHEQLAIDVIPNWLLLPLVLFVPIYLVVMRDTATPVMDARVVEVSAMMMVMRGRGVLENLVRQDVQLSWLLIIFNTKVREVMLGLTCIEFEGRV
jgi:hypothetical protein